MNALTNSNHVVYKSYEYWSEYSEIIIALMKLKRYKVDNYINPGNGKRFYHFEELWLIEVQYVKYNHFDL